MSRYHNTSPEDSYQDPLDAPLRFTRFKNLQAKERQEKTVTLRGLVAAIPGRVAKAKDKLPLIKLATFGDVPTVHGCLRHDANMHEVDGIEIDYDAGDMPPSEAIGRFRKAGVAAAILTSPSHLQPYKGQRWRGLLPLSRPVQPEEREQYVAWANGLLGGVLGTESFTTTQAFYAGAVEGWHPVEVHLSEGGRYLDTANELAAKAIGRPNHVKAAGGTKLDEKAALAAIRSGASYHESLMALGGHWANAGVPMVETRARLEAAMKAIPEGGRRAEWADRFSDIGRGLAFIYGDRFKEAVVKERDLLADFDGLIPAEEDAEIDALVDGPKEEDPAQDDLATLSPDDCANFEPVPYIVKELIAERDMVTVVGAPGVGKSVVVPHVAYAVAQGREVFGRRTRQGVVLYLAAENDRDMQKRISALRAKHGPCPDFHMLPGCGGRFRDKDFLRKLQRLIQRLKPSLIVVDTLRAALPGIKENDSEGMGEAITTMRSLTKWGAAVLLVDHDNVAGSGLPRGHGSLHGDVDMNLALKRNEDKIVVGTPTKNRNGPSYEPVLAYEIKPVPLNKVDQDGDPLTTVICEESDAGEAKGKRLPRAASAAYVILRKLSQGGKGVPETVWRDACVNGRDVSTSEDEDNRARAFRRAKDVLTDEGMIGFRDGDYSLVGNRPVDPKEWTNDFPDPEGEA